MTDPSSADDPIDALENAPCAFHSTDRNGVIRNVNATWLRWLGYTREEVVGRIRTQDLLTPAFAPRFAALAGEFLALSARGPIDDFEAEFLRKDGSTLYAQLSISAVRDADGEFLWSRVAFIDITRRKRAEARLRQLIELTPDATVVVDPNNRVEFASPQVEALLGYTPAELLGRPAEALFPEHRAASLWAAQGEPRARAIELWARRKDGSRRALEIRIGRIDDDGRTLVLAALRDVTERHMAESLARAASVQLAEAVDAIDDGFAVFTRDRRLAVCNRAYRELFGDRLPGPLEGRHSDELAAVMLGDESAPQRERTALSEVRARTNDAVYADTELTWRGRIYRAVVRDTAEGGRVVVLSDRTEERRREEALRAANAAKSEFLSVMSHELRTPLNSILGFGQLLQRDRRTPLSPRQATMVGHVVQSGEHLLHLIDDVLDLARIEAGRMTMSFESIDLAPVLEDVRATLEPMAARSGISLAIEAADPATSRVRADRTRLVQVLMNFGSNAIKYGRHGGSVRFTTAGVGERVRLTVRDDGIGIPRERQAEIFQPFQRAGHEAGPIEGTGIGLAITQRLAELMGGGVGFHSVVGEGSSFWVELPAAPPVRPAAEPCVDPPPPEVAQAPAQRCRIVYIEDNPANIDLMEALIAEFESTELTTAPTAERGVALVRAQRPDVVILDINLPGMDGYAALAQLRAWPETRRIPVIALSAAAMPEDLRRGAEAGFFRYFTKPLDVDALVAALAEIHDCGVPP
jgi:PAS domain S-box-containing protein